jgi:hypothetical protein
MSLAVSTPAAYHEDAAPLSEQEDTTQSSRGIGIAIGIAMLVALVVILSTIIYFCVRRKRMVRHRNRPRSQAAPAGKPLLAPLVWVELGWWE